MSERIARIMSGSAEGSTASIWQPGSKETTDALLRMSGVDPESSLDKALYDMEPVRLTPELLALMPAEDVVDYQAMEANLADPTYGGCRNT